MNNPTKDVSLTRHERRILRRLLSDRIQYLREGHGHIDPEAHEPYIDRLLAVRRKLG